MSASTSALLEWYQAKLHNEEFNISKFPQSTIDEMIEHKFLEFHPTKPNLYRMPSDAYRLAYMMCA